MGKRYIHVGRHRISRIGLPPGTLISEGGVPAPARGISLFAYTEKSYTEESFDTLPDLSTILKKGCVTWLNVESVNDVETLEKIGTEFSIHPLILEDIQNTDQRPKIEEFRDYLYISFKMLSWNSEQGTINQESVSLIVGKNYVISFQIKPGDVFDPIRDRIRNNKGRLRREGADYLAYALLDSVVDNYFLILESLDGVFDDLEEKLFLRKQDNLLEMIHSLRAELVTLRRTVWPLGEVLNSLKKEDFTFIKKGTRIFFKDIYDHIIQAQEMADIFRDNIAGLLDYHVTQISNMMGSVMKMLTIIATIFIPLTFIVGIYGMNFHYMPELEWRYSYPAILILMALLTGGMILYFKRKRWM